VTFPPLPQSKLIFDQATPEGCKAELTWLACYISRWYIRPKTVTHSSTNRTRRALTSTTTPRRQPSICLSRRSTRLYRATNYRPALTAERWTSVRRSSSDHGIDAGRGPTSSAAGSYQSISTHTMHVAAAIERRDRQTDGREETRPLSTLILRTIWQASITLQCRVVYRVGQKGGPQTHDHNSVKS